MQSFEIPDDQWIGFFDRFSREHAGWPITIELLDQQLGPQRIAEELPLQGISFDVSGTRPSSIEVGAGDSPDANVTHVIDLPLHIRMADDPGAGAGTIQIEPARGAATLVHFHRPA